MPFIYAVAVAIVAQMFIYAGLTFMSGKLFPDMLTPLYHLIPGGNYRFLISSMTVILAGNYLFQRLYLSQPVLNAGIISVTVGICIVSILGLMAEHKPPSPLLMLGLGLVMAGAAITIYARGRL
jgi:hypothetical protein